MLGEHWEKAPSNGHKGIVESSIIVGGVNLKGENGNKSLELASQNGHSDIVELLIAQYEKNLAGCGNIYICTVLKIGCIVKRWILEV